MTDSARLATEKDRILLYGEIDFANVMALEQRGSRWLREQAPPECRLDLAGVGHCNSAIAALLLSWMRTAQAEGKRIAMENPPVELRGIMELAGLEDALSLAPDSHGGP